MHVRKGDAVVVISGNDKGKRGSIKAVLREENRVVIDGVNLRWKHKKPSQKNPKGERVQVECSIHASNVMLVDPKTDEPTRKRHEGSASRKGGAGARKSAKSPKAAAPKKKEAPAS